MTKRVITRWQAAPIHLALSALVAVCVFATIFFVWYPGALFGAAGGRDLFMLIAGVDVVIGPLITFIIFKPGKKGLKFDLAVIAVLQLAALSYGVWVLYESRPVWIVYVKDRFELVRANQIFDQERAKAKPPFDQLALSGPLLAGAHTPKDPDEQLRIATTALQGQDIQTYPQYFVPYDDVRDEAIAHANPVSRLRELNPDAGGRIDRLVAKYGGRPSALAFLPMRAGKRDLAVLVDAKTGRYLGTTALKPWQY